MATKSTDTCDDRPTVDFDRIKSLGRELLVAIGEDPDRPELVETPARWARMWRDFIEYEPGNVDTVFDNVRADQMVLVRGMRVWSLCEHHLLPFWCDVTVAYMCDAKVLGLSKFARVAHKHAHRLQVQERLVEGVAQEIKELTDSPDVAVVASGEHLCMSMRGIQTPARMVSSALYGRFRDDPLIRQEFMTLMQPASTGDTM